jgi:hypothetical protein
MSLTYTPNAQHRSVWRGSDGGGERNNRRRFEHEAARVTSIQDYARLRGCERSLPLITRQRSDNRREILSARKLREIGVQHLIVYLYTRGIVVKSATTLCNAEPACSRCHIYNQIFDWSHRTNTQTPPRTNRELK